MCVHHRNAFMCRNFKTKYIPNTMYDKSICNEMIHFKKVLAVIGAIKDPVMFT